MNISNLARLLNAKMLNLPSISAVTNFTTNLSKVSRGTAFFALNKDSKQIAKEMGAYAIISSDDKSDDDGEIAYLQVQNIYQAMVRLLRFIAANMDVKFVLASDLELRLLSLISTHNSIFIVKNLEHLFENIHKIKQNHIIFLKDQALIKDLSNNYEILHFKEFIPYKTSSIFYSTFSVDGSFYSHINLPIFYAKELASVIANLKRFNVEFKMGDFRELFEPIFISSKLKVMEFGMSQRAIIAQKDFFDIVKDRILKLAPDTIIWENSIENFINIAQKKQPLTNHIEHDLINRITKQEYRYILLRSNKDEVLSLLKGKNTEQESLFNI